MFQLLQMILIDEFSDMIIISLYSNEDTEISIIELILIWIAWSWTSISYHILELLEI